MQDKILELCDCKDKFFNYGVICAYDRLQELCEVVGEMLV